MNIRGLAFIIAVIAAATSSARAQNNEPPPAGAILDLNGGAVPHGSPVQYTVDFTGALTNTQITFAFREDPAFLYFSSASVVDLANPSVNLLTNGNFQGGTYTDNGNNLTPIGWTYANVFGAGAGGVVESDSGTGRCGAFGSCWVDGAIQAYDAITQVIPTTVGHNYQISFFLSDNGGLTTFMDQSNNGQPGTEGNGIDVLAYAQAGLPTPGVPEPSTWAMLLLGFAGLGFAFRHSRRKVSFA